MNKKEYKKSFCMMLSIGSLLVILIIWELVTDVFGVFTPQLLPSPSAVVKAFLFKLANKNPDGSVLFTHVLSSLKIAVSGYVLGAVTGIPLGIMMGWYKPVDKLVKPLFDFIRNIPAIAWITLFIIWFGIGVFSKSMIIFIGSFIATVVNSSAGIRQTSIVHIWVAKTFGATNFEMLKKVAVPSALPLIFTGLKVGLSMSWMSLVAAELVAASSGLGYMIQIARAMGRPDIVIVGMLTIAAIGAILTGILEVLEKKTVKRGKRI